MKITEEIKIIKFHNAIGTDEHINDDDNHSFSSKINKALKDKNLEERVQVLEFQMEALDPVGRGLVTLEDKVNYFGISNIRLNNVVTELDVRVTMLESQKGTNDNVVDELNELNQRVDVLEEGVTDQYITVSNLDEDVNTLQETTEDLNEALNDEQFSLQGQ